MSSMWGDKIKVSIFGESHGEFIGVTIDGLPAGENIDLNLISIQMSRRAPGNEEYSTPRKEKDVPKIISGFLNGKTTGTPMCAIIKNEGFKSENYNEIMSLVRPGHADYTNNIKYNGYNDFRGGGHSSGRITAALTFAGAVCTQILNRRKIYIGAHIYSIYNILDDKFNYTDIDKNLIKDLNNSKFPVICNKKGEKMIEAINYAKSKKNSVGGIVECAVVGVLKGIGEPMFNGIENSISSVIFSIPGVKGIEFGSGFSSCNMYGSENNDSFIIKNGDIQTETNNHGGSLGGISSGMPIIFRVAIKPTPSIQLDQKTVDIISNEEKTISVKGMHDPCIVPRAVPVVESVTALSIINLLWEAGML